MLFSETGSNLTDIASSSASPSIPITMLESLVKIILSSPAAPGKPTVERKATFVPYNLTCSPSQSSEIS